MAKAVQFDSYGGRDVLYLADIDVPEPGDGEIRVDVKAAGVNPGEASIREGKLEEMYHTDFPSGEGTDFAGVVESVGSGVDNFKPGDEVLGWTWDRASHAERLTVPAAQVTPKPADLPMEVAGALDVVATTAYAAVEAVDAKEGDTVAVSAAAGGVGGFVVQLLAMRGCTVLGIASSSNAEWLESKGVTPVEYGDGLADRLRAAAPDGIDAFIDTFGPDYVHLAVDLGVKPNRINTIIAFEAAGEVGAQAKGSQEAANKKVLAEMADLVASGKVEVPVAATYPLDRVADAFAELEKRHTRGKIVLIP